MTQSPFDWRQYLRIDDSFSPAERSVVERALNDITRFHDGEGQQLIRRAFEVRGERVVILPSADGNLFRASTLPVIRLDLPFGSAVQLKGSEPNISVVTHLVHELYHAADSTRDLNEQARATLLKICGLAADDPRAARLLAMVRAERRRPNEDSDARQIVWWLLKPASFAAALEKNGMPELAQAIAPLTTGQRAAMLRQAGVVRHVPKAQFAHTSEEEDATRYTDALMLRNYGPAYQPRQLYDRAIFVGPAPVFTGLDSEEIARRTHYRSLTGQDFATPGFTAEPYAVGNLGELPPPTVRAHQSAPVNPQRSQ